MKVKRTFSIFQTKTLLSVFYVFCHVWINENLDYPLCSLDKPEFPTNSSLHTSGAVTGMSFLVMCIMFWKSS